MWPPESQNGSEMGIPGTVEAKKSRERKTQQLLEIP